MSRNYFEGLLFVTAEFVEALNTRVLMGKNKGWKQNIYLSPRTDAFGKSV